MSYELVINSAPTGVVVALLKDKKLIELHEEGQGNDFSVGDVYLGKVRKVVPSLNAAFVDVGYEKDAFLHYLDLGPQFDSLNKFVQGSITGKQQGSSIAKNKIQPDINKDGKIGDLLSTKQLIAVQIAKEPISSKGPRLSSEITLAGRYIVLVPFSNKISISQKIKDAEERERLKVLLSSIKPKNFGVIIRTVAQNKKVADLDQDLRDLVQKWDKLHRSLSKAAPPKRVLGEMNRTSTVLRDMLSERFTEINIDDAKLFDEVKGYVKTIAPQKENIVKLYKGRVGSFEHFGINKQIKASFGKKVMLPSGAYLIVEHTEAMHVIDVNSGNRKASEQNQEQNAVETNLEVIPEIARILRLRDMGGIVVIDFIDMHERENNRKVYDALKAAMQEDRAKHNILPPSKFGVVELTRQRVRPETDIKTSESCPTCKGSGEVQASVLLVDEIEHNVRYLDEKGMLSGVSLEVHPFVAAYLKKGVKSYQNRWLLRFKKRLPIVAKTNYHLLQYNFIGADGDALEI